jgi:hypothetical protein
MEQNLAYKPSPIRLLPIFCPSVFQAEPKKILQPPVREHLQHYNQIEMLKIKMYLEIIKTPSVLIIITVSVMISQGKCVIMMLAKVNLEGMLC